MLEHEQAGGRQQIELSLDVRYYGQTPYINMVLDEVPRDGAAIEAIVERYGEEYEREFGYRFDRDLATVEIVNARAAAIGVTADTELRAFRRVQRTARARGRRARSTSRRPAASSTRRSTSAGGLAKDARVAGPAVIEQADTTVLRSARDDPARSTPT